MLPRFYPWVAHVRIPILRLSTASLSIFQINPPINTLDCLHLLAAVSSTEVKGGIHILLKSLSAGLSGTYLEVGLLDGIVFVFNFGEPPSQLHYFAFSSTVHGVPMSPSCLEHSCFVLLLCYG